MLVNAREKSSLEKVTVVLPQLLKSEVMQLKETLHMSMNNIYQTAIAEYVAKKARDIAGISYLEIPFSYNK